MSTTIITRPMLPRNPPAQGKKETITTKKRANENTVKKLYKIGLKGRAARMSECCNTVEGELCPSCGRYHISRTTRCRDKLCAVCQGALARKRYAEMIQVYDYIAPSIEGRKMAMLTLTVRNCRIGQLPDTLRAMATAYKRLSQRIWWRAHVLGAGRGMEITYNPSRGDYHPHYHVLLIIDDPTTPDAYLTTALAEMWRDAMRLSYNPIVDYRAVYARAGTPADEAPRAAWLEASKYAVKSETLAAVPDGDFAAFVCALGGAQTITYSGIIRRARRALGLHEEEQVPDEDAPLPRCAHCNAETAALIAAWAGGTYWDTQTGAALPL